MLGVRHETSFELEQNIELVFPLFSPEGETRWVPGWSYRNVMGTTALREDYVFTTADHDHVDHEGSEAVWIVKRFEPVERRVEFYKVEAGAKVGIVGVRCTSLAPARTRVDVSYEYIALSARGEAFVEGFTAEVYAAFIAEWKTLLDEYFGRRED